MVLYTQNDFTSGLWHRSQKQLDTFYDGENTTGEQYPAIASRPPRRIWLHPSSSVYGMFCSEDDLYIARDEHLYRALEQNKVFSHGTVNTYEKKFAMLGNQLLIIPDFRVLINNWANQEYDWNLTESRYVKLSLSGVTVQNNNTLICSSYNFLDYFSAGDSVIIQDSNSKHRAYTIRAVEANSLLFDDNSLADSTMTSCTLYLDCPLSLESGLCTCGNRVWAYCNDPYYYNGPIFATVPGDVTNWFRYDGDATSSYRASVPSGGAVTGCVAHGGLPVFFTENSIVQINGDDPTNYAITETGLHGVRSDSASSLCSVGHNLFYLSTVGVVKYDGTTATVISEGLGEILAEGVATTDGRHYYLSAVNGQGTRALYVYDTVLNAWHKEDGDFTYMGYLKGDVYGYSPSGNFVYILGQDTTGNGTATEQVSSYVEFHPLIADTSSGIIPQRLAVRVECEADCALTLSVSYDNGEWEECAQLQSEGSHLWDISLEERSCHSLGVRIDGVGAYKILSLIIEDKEEDKQTDTQIQVVTVYSPCNGCPYGCTTPSKSGMIDQLIIGDRASFDDFYASIAKRKIGEAKKKSIKETVPYSNVTYDFSKINGELYWEERELEYIFEIIAPTPEKLEELKSKFAGWVKNVFQEELHDPFIPEYHFLATYDDMDFEDEEGLDKTTATVKFMAYPYKISNQPVVFEGSAVGTHTASFIVDNQSAHPVPPTVLVEASSQMTAFVVIDGTTCSFETGTAVQLPARLPVGVTTITATIPSYYEGFTVKVSFHEEVF